jgi:anti-sigma regulatory factor (Ser/Thr protein kinase)
MTLTNTERLLVKRIDLRLSAEPEAALAARHSLDQLENLLPPARLEDVRLVVSELVTNSVRHAGLSAEDQITLSVMVSGRSVCGRVCDPGPGFEKPSNPRPRRDLSGGWGLPILERISDRWGVERNGRQGGLTCVWFEID